MEPELKIFTAAQVLDWLENGRVAEGLSEQVIAPVRAWAIAHNPYVKPEDAIVATIYEGEELAAYTAAFPDMIDGKRIWWASTLWCNPKFQGQGYGLIVIGSLMEAHEPELTYDRWGAHETVEIFNCLGYKTTYTNRYFFGDKAINRTTLKGKLAYTLQQLKKYLHHTPYTVHHTPYTLTYSTFIDGEAYAFMQAHRGTDSFLREQKMLNWMLQYPFAQGCAIKDRVEKDTMFSANATQYGYSVVKVYNGTELVGVYILRECSDNLSVVCLYYQELEKERVLASVVDHIQTLKAKGVMTESEQFKNYLNKHLYFPKQVTDKISFSVPESVELPDEVRFQLGDGDSFA